MILTCTCIPLNITGITSGLLLWEADKSRTESQQRDTECEGARSDVFTLLLLLMKEALWSLPTVSFTSQKNTRTCIWAYVQRQARKHTLPWSLWLSASSSHKKKKKTFTHYTLTHRQGGGWGSSQMVQKTTGGCGDQGTPFDSCSFGNEVVKEAAVVLCMSLNWWLCVIVSAVDTIMFFRGSFHLISWLLLTLHRM